MVLSCVVTREKILVQKEKKQTKGCILSIFISYNAGLEKLRIKKNILAKVINA